MPFLPTIVLPMQLYCIEEWLARARIMFISFYIRAYLFHWADPFLISNCEFIMDILKTKASYSSLRIISIIRGFDNHCIYIYIFSQETYTRRLYDVLFCIGRHTHTHTHAHLVPIIFNDGNCTFRNARYLRSEVYLLCYYPLK